MGEKYISYHVIFFLNKCAYLNSKTIQLCSVGAFWEFKNSFSYNLLRLLNFFRTSLCLLKYFYYRALP